MEINILKCPICGANLINNGKSLLCENRHNFDIAKEGYVNLLPVGEKKSKNPGDGKEMVLARNNFLKLGFFNELREQIDKIIFKNFKDGSIILDAGCGTGYYSENLNLKYNCLGIDISKDAIKLASKQNKFSSFVVASIFNLPVKDNSVDCILNIFAPKPNEEFKRVLKKSGKIIEIVPGKNHLIELKKVLYEQFKTRTSEYKQFNLKLLETKEIEYNKTLNKDELVFLLEMTPYYYTTKKEKLSKLNVLNEIDITFSFILKTWEKV